MDDKNMISKINSEIRKTIEKQIEEDIKHPKFPKVGVGYMYFDSEHALKQKRRVENK